MSRPHPRAAARGAHVTEILRWGLADTAKMFRDWRPPELPEPDDERPRREPRPRRYPEPVWGRTPTARLVRRNLQRRGLFPLLTALGRPDVIGVHHLDTLRPPFILAPNHSSHTDAPLVLQALPAHVRERTLVPAAADYFFQRRWLSVLVTLGINAVPFDRTNEIADSVRRCERFLRHGYSIVLFPEGTRSQDGRLRGFKAGVAHLAVNTGAPVVPVYLQGTHHLLARGRALPRPSAVCVHVGAPLVAGPDETARQFNDRLEEAVTGLAGDARGWRHRDEEPRPPSWLESWEATQHQAVADDVSVDTAWDDARRRPGTLAPPATPGRQGSWIASWRSTTPR